jgi:hypothetical protein
MKNTSNGNFQSCNEIFKIFLHKIVSGFMLHLVRAFSKYLLNTIAIVVENAVIIEMYIKLI